MARGGMFLWVWRAAREAEEDEGGGEQEGEVAQGRGDAELACDEATEAAAFERLAVEDVDVVESVCGEGQEERGGEQSARANRARPEEERGGCQLRRDDGEGGGPDPAWLDEVREVRGEVGDRVELRAGGEEEERREAEAAELDERVEERATVHRCLRRMASAEMSSLPIAICDWMRPLRQGVRSVPPAVAGG